MNIGNFEKFAYIGERALIVLLIISIAFLSASAQDEKTITVNTDLVNLSVAVADAKGNYLENLQKEQFEIYDNGKKQTIEYFSAADAPVSFGIVYDLHPTTDERTTAVLESLREFAKGLKGNDDIFALVFNRRGSLTTDFIPTAEQIEKNLDGAYREPNALYDAIFAATEKLGKSRNLKRVLFVITDSADHNSERRFSDIINRLKTLDAQIYAVLWDEAEDWRFRDITRNGEQRRRVSSDATGFSRAELQGLALRTGGTMRSPTVQNAAELFRIYNQIAFETRRQYTLGFYPEKSDGEWHELQINLRSVENRKKMVLSYRLGYQSPPPKL
jgi:Ca-activated chloride channel homolog